MQGNSRRRRGQGGEMLDMPEGLWEKVFIKHILVYHEYLPLQR